MHAHNLFAREFNLLRRIVLLQHELVGGPADEFLDESAGRGAVILVVGVYLNNHIITAARRFGRVNPDGLAWSEARHH
ncbi:p068 [Rhizobium phage 16-3]|uniref:p068 n=1 Tax=Rhizobium phage 16-3 TaxID=10704 RepID=UPI00017BA615|nr:p068 [Rhizobium phage 16-3]ABF71322.1 p068 [Rhizobium phage 16-3]